MQGMPKVKIRRPKWKIAIKNALANLISDGKKVNDRVVFKAKDMKRQRPVAYQANSK
jgi:hypothetical protein